MKILVDTNILISALLFPKSKPAKALIHVSEQHEMVLCDQNLREVREVLQRKAAHVLPDAEVLLNELSYELIPAAYNAEKLIMTFLPRCARHVRLRIPLSRFNDKKSHLEGDFL